MAAENTHIYRDGYIKALQADIDALQALLNGSKLTADRMAQETTLFGVSVITGVVNSILSPSVSLVMSNLKTNGDDLATLCASGVDDDWS